MQKGPDSSLGRGFTQSDAALKMSQVNGWGRAFFWSLCWFMDLSSDMTEEWNIFRLTCELPEGSFPYWEGGHWHDKRPYPTSAGSACLSAFSLGCCETLCLRQEFWAIRQTIEGLNQPILVKVSPSQRLLYKQIRLENTQRWCELLLSIRYQRQNSRLFS